VPFTALEELIVGRGRELDERRKRLFLALSIAIAAPALFVYSLIDVAEGRLLEGLSALPAAAALLVVLPLLRRVRGVVHIFRLVFVLTLFLMVSQLAIGAGEGQAFLWFYFLPLLVFYVAGSREGLAWVALSAAAAAGVFFGVSHAYPVTTGLRFLVTYAIVAILAYGLESSRRRWYEELQQEKEALRQALVQVKTLRRLLPICASCKRVRDDKGYWTMLDQYLEEHADVDLSHGLCPDCMKALYPEFSDEPAPAQRDPR
jgi:hypothetical protein